MKIQLDCIDANPAQPRRRFEDLEQLAESIKADGLLEPIMVRPMGERFQIVHGERRWRACKIAGLAKIDATIREMDAARRRQHQHVVHEADVEQAQARHALVQVVEEEGADQWAQGTAQRYAPVVVEELPAPLDRTPQVLADQVQDRLVLDMDGQTVEETVVVDGGVVGLHVGLEHEAVVGQLRHDLAHCRLGPAVAPDVGAAGRDRQVLRQHEAPPTRSG